MMSPFKVTKELVRHVAMSSALMLALGYGPAPAHEILPAIADMTETKGRLSFSITLSVEALLAGIDLSSLTDTSLSTKAQAYDQLRAQERQDLKQGLLEFWPTMAQNIVILADSQRLTPIFDAVDIPPSGELDLVRSSKLEFHADLPMGATAVQMGWSPDYGTLVLRQKGVDAPYTGYLEAGDLSGLIALHGGGQMSMSAAFLTYVPVGFDHIVPKGLDHILFVLGLFFFSTAWRPLAIQISVFTLAHTLTLALAALGYVRLPANIVEPLIAASIVFVAVENLFSKGLSRSRPFVVFGFGLLHGLGFASVMAEFGLPQNAFIPALIGFNIGVECGQIAIVALAYLLISYWFGGRPWYRRRVTLPISGAIALIGAWWVIERTLL
ncbi:MAG: HupE/UreJ family protein [Paracoccaceae bacterium]